MAKRFLTTEELAEYVEASVNTVRYWRYVGSGPAATKVGRRVLYDVADVEAWIAKGREGAVMSGAA